MFWHRQEGSNNKFHLSRKPLPTINMHFLSTNDTLHHHFIYIYTTNILLYFTYRVSYYKKISATFGKMLQEIGKMSNEVELE